MNLLSKFFGPSPLTFPLELRSGRRHGWHPDTPDHRDHLFVRCAPRLSIEGVDLRSSPFNLPIFDQLSLGACTGNGGSRIFGFDQNKQGLSLGTPSRLEIYYNARRIEGTVRQDSGAQIRDVVKGLSRWGATSESLWPYNIKKFRTALPKAAVADSLKHKAIVYERVDNSDGVSIRHALSLGFPVIFGATLYESFESDLVAVSGQVPMPLPNESPVGGHCMVIMGYTPTSWIVANSWGPSWGDHGYCYFPLLYLTDLNLACDFWILETVS